jgi:hypothetical protein
MYFPDGDRSHPHIVGFDRRSLLAAGAALLMLAGNAGAQQVPIPTTPAEVPGPPPGTAMTTAYVQTVGRIAYLWGWPLVNSVNRSKAFAEAPEPGLQGGVVPVAFDQNAMLTGYISPYQHFIAAPNQDVVYGAGWMALDKGPSSSRSRISAIASGSTRTMTRAPTSSPR